MIIKLIILSISFSIASGIFKAICDLSDEVNLKGNPLFWHKNKSWKNKWKNGDKKQGKKFFGIPVHINSYHCTIIYNIL